jgi:hypothetical protein
MTTRKIQCLSSAVTQTIIILLMAAALSGATVFAAEPSAALSAPELLAKYTAALNRAQSLILKFEGSSDCFNQFIKVTGPSDSFDGTKVSGRPMKSYYRIEIRSDGRRFGICIYQWGNVGSATEWTPENQPAYNSLFFDGNQMYGQNKGINKPGSVGLASLENNVAPNNGQMLLNGTAYSEMRGFLPPTQYRLDAIVRAARSLSVRPRAESVNGQACYVLDAFTDYGKICLWLDPAHGYQAAKATQNIASGNMGAGGQRIPAGSTEQRFMEVTRFEQKSDVWVPYEIKISNDMNFATTREFSHATATYKCTEVILNPDHDALHSFDWRYDPELKEGAKFHFAGQLDNYIWQGGKLVTDPVHPRSGIRPRRR